jgi:hypothetical protein
MAMRIMVASSGLTAFLPNALLLRCISHFTATFARENFKMKVEVETRKKREF